MVARMTMRLVPVVLASLALTSPVQADDLPDPTRPPAALLDTAVPATPTDALRLQSVLLGTGRTPAAVISGELVLLGGRVRDARLVRITERSAVLRGPHGETTLSLTPDARKEGASTGAQETRR